MIQVIDLCKSYGGKAVLQDVSFTIERGVVCVMAPSGTGKTTLLRILLGLEQPDRGSILLPENCRMSAVFQEHRLLEQLDALGNLRFAAGTAFREQKALEMLKELGLEDVGRKPVGAYSGGMKRRVALARALLVPWDLLLLDEPFSGLDGENRSKAIRCIRRHAGERPVLLVTHDSADVQALDADRIVL